MKEPLLLLHGAVSCQKQFAALLPLLRNRFEVHVMDFPGHGGTAIPEAPFSIPYFASSVLDYLDTNKIQRVSIFGYSMGGYVGLFLAARHPERIKNVFTLATKFGWTPFVAAKEAAMLDPEKIIAKVPAFADRLKKMHAPQDWKIIFVKTAGMLLDLGEAPSLSGDDLVKIKASVCIAIGALDKMVSVEESEIAVAQIRNSRLLLLPEIEHPFEKVNARMLANQIHSVFHGVPAK